jgi:hypothetical protein
MTNQIISSSETPEWKRSTEVAGRYFSNRTLKRIANAAGATVREVVEFIGADWTDYDEHVEWVANAKISEIEGWVVAGLR